MKQNTILKKRKERKVYVRQMFNTIAHRYDLLNHLLSMGIDFYWRKKAISKLDIKEDGLVLDLACGTGDFALETIARKNCKVVGVDIARRMLIFGKKKIDKKSLVKQISFANADGERLPFADESFDGATIAFGIRNMGNVDQALKELYRVLKKDAQLIILEFSMPGFKPFQAFYLFYFNHILPRIGRLISGDKEAYTYLPLSVEDFPSIEDFSAQVAAAGFSKFQFWKLLNGVAVIYRGGK